MKTKKIAERAKKIKPGKVLRAAAEKDSDITERKQAESQREAALKAMVKSENRFRSIFESSRDAIMTLEPPCWKFTSGNPAALKIFMAKDEADFASHEPWAMSPERQPDGRASAEKAKEMIETAMRDGSNFFEWTHKRLNGEEFPATVLLTRMILAEKTMLQATVRDITESKRVESQREAALEALQKAHDELDSQVQERTAELAQANEMLQADISERKLAESQREAALKTLRESEDRYRDLIENSQDLIYTHDLEGKLLSVNEAAVRLTGYPLKDLLGMNMADLLVPEVRHLFKGYMTEIQATGWARGTMRIRTASGEPRYLEYYNTLRTKGVAVPVVRGLGHDITERERAEKIQHIQYNIANAMIKAETLSDFLETVRNELSSLIDTTNFLLALYDEASGMLSAPFEKDEKDAIPQWPAEKSLTGLVIRQKRSMLLSREQILQMFQAGTIELIGTTAEAWLGVPDEIKTRLFEPFFTTKEVGQGTGLGLSIAHTLVTRSLGGKIWVEDNEMGGASFKVALPIRAPTPGPSPNSGGGGTEGGTFPPRIGGERGGAS